MLVLRLSVILKYLSNGPTKEKQSTTHDVLIISIAAAFSLQFKAVIKRERERVKRERVKSERERQRGSERMF